MIRSHQQDAPFFMYLTPTAPHREQVGLSTRFVPPTPAARHANLYANENVSAAIKSYLVLAESFFGVPARRLRKLQGMVTDHRLHDTTHVPFLLWRPQITSPRSPNWGLVNPAIAGDFNLTKAIVKDMDQLYLARLRVLRAVDEMLDALGGLPYERCRTRPAAVQARL